MEAVFMNTESSKTDELDKFVLHLSQRSDLRNLNKYVAVQNCLHVEKYKTPV